MFFQSLIPFPGLRATFFGQFTWLLVFSCFSYLEWYGINIDVTGTHLHQMTDWSILINVSHWIECLVLLLSLPLSIHSNHSLLLFLSNNVEKDTTLLLLFLSKSPGGHAISFQVKPWVAFWLPYLLIESFYIGMPVVRTDGRTVGVRSRDYQIFSDG